jgi:DNA-3-methyladenine glycosylase II
MTEIVKDLSLRDRKLCRVIEESPLCTIGNNSQRVTHFEALVRSVVSQQLAVKAAESIFLNIKNLVNDEITPSKVTQISMSEMRKAGISGAKYKTIQALADSHLTNKLNIDKLHKLRDEKMISESLTSIWGIGPWTVDMFLIFQLRKLDIWPITDLGVRRGWEKIYSLKNGIDIDSLEKKGEKFRPYRSVVAWYCWRALD